MTSSSPDEVFVRIDRNGDIVEVGGAWQRSAPDNSGSSIDAEKVVGSNLYDHISGHFTKIFLKRFIAEVRERGTRTRLVYRCDSPSQKQLMEMRAEPEDRDHVRLTHRMIEAAQLPFDVPVTTASSWKAARARRCSMCNRLQMKTNSEWLEPEEAAEPGANVLVIHSVCPDCRKGITVKGLS